MPVDSHAKLQRDVLEAAHMMVDMWPTFLDGLDGLVQQTVARGWPEPLARQLVVGLVAPVARPEGQ